jgi:hypothetical protein
MFSNWFRPFRCSGSKTLSASDFPLVYRRRETYIQFPLEIHKGRYGARLTVRCGDDNGVGIKQEK